MNKKGDLTDSISFAMWAFVFGIGLIALVFAFLTFYDALDETALNDDNATAAAITESTTYIALSLPSTYFVILFGLLLGTLVSAYFIRVHPIFMPVYILAAVLSIIVAVALGNAWGAIQDVEEFQDILELNTVLSTIDLILSNIVLLTLLVFILSFVIIFAKPGGGVGGGAPI